MTEIRPPWDAATVDALNAYQRGGRFHPFTCPNDRSDLLATADGWTCGECSYTQDWAHEFMADPENAKPFAWPGTVDEILWRQDELAKRFEDHDPEGPMSDG